MSKAGNLGRRNGADAHDVGYGSISTDSELLREVRYSVYGAHSQRRTKATLIYWRTGNLRAVQLLLGHTKIESTVRYLEVEVGDAIALSEQIDI